MERRKGVNITYNIFKMANIFFFKNKHFEKNIINNTKSNFYSIFLVNFHKDYVYQGLKNNKMCFKFSNLLPNRKSK